MKHTTSAVPGMTIQVQAVLAVLLTADGAEFYGADIAQRAGLLPGTTYLNLARLVRVGWITGRWEQVDPRQVHRPRRHYYQLTDRGVVVAQNAIDHTRHQHAGTAPR